MNVKEVMGVLKVVQALCIMCILFFIMFNIDFRNFFSGILKKNVALMNFCTFINFYVLMNYLADISEAIIQLKL